MQNLVFTVNRKSQINFGDPIRVAYEHATKTIIILDTQNKLSFLSYSPESSQAILRKQTPPIVQLEGSNVVLLQYLVDTSSVLILTQNGSILTISQDGDVDVKAQNDDGISGGSISPVQEHIYVVTKNNTIIQLDMDFDLVSQVPLDDHQMEKSDSFDPRFSWKADGSFFAINIMTDKGRKCHTRDHMLGIFRSPSLSDPDPQGLVQSVSEKSRDNMGPLVSWQPSGGLIAGIDFINKGGKKINRVIFWEKNGLRHLQFELPPLVTDVLDLKWSADSEVLGVEVLLINSQRYLYLYYRSNYHWYLKNQIHLSNQNSKYFLIKNKTNQVIVIDKGQINVFQYILSFTPNTWKTLEQENKNATMLQVSVDGSQLKVTDFNLGLIPAPMSHHVADFDSNIHGVAIKNDWILILAQSNGYLCHWNGKDLKQRKSLNFPLSLYHILQAPIQLRLTQVQPKFIFTHSNKLYEIQENGEVLDNENSYEIEPYAYFIDKQRKQVRAELKEGSLFINDEIYVEHCTSFTFYHEFLIFTVSTSGMYDKMFVFDLVLDDLNEHKESIKLRLEQFESKKLLNYRATERGSRIIGCSKNRIIFQLPRGNFEGIYPKVITIKHVKKCLQQNKFKQAFETIRTHKLDMNLLFDIDPKRFADNAEAILTGIQRTDYLNLFVSQLKEGTSSELVYCQTQKQIDNIEDYINVQIEGKKVRHICEIVSQTLRKNNKKKYILSIFTSDIKMGLLNQVLFEIKDMRSQDKDLVIPPHLEDNQNQSTKKQLSSQDILEYVCWLVDANAIYEASLLTYDLELASMTARCTQMDPKQYIPYLEELKIICDPIELRKKICLDLKKFEKAVEEMSKGDEKQINESIELVKKYKLFKCGLKTYATKPTQLNEVRTIVINDLISSSENNQAFKLCLSIGNFERALEIGIKLTDGKKIKEALECFISKTREEREKMAEKIISDIGEDGFKNKNDLAKLKAYIGEYDSATSLYLGTGNYQKAFKYFVKSSLAYRESDDFKNKMALQYSLQKNQLLKQKQQFLQKSIRLSKVHKQRAIEGFPSMAVRNVDNEDMYSQVSVSSKANSSYTVSTTTGLKRKRDKKRSILSRNVKQGSPLEEQYLVAFLTDLINKAEGNIKQTKLLIQYLIYANLIQQAESLRNVCKQYAEIASRINPKFYAQVKFQNDHPEFADLVEAYENKGVIEQEKTKDRKKDRFTMDSFAYIF